jgi:hypothetical protein
MNGGDTNGSGNDDDSVSYDGGVRRRLVLSFLSLSSSTSHRLFLVRLAGGKMGGGSLAEGFGSAECSGSAGCSAEAEGWSLAVGAMVVDGGQAAMVADGHRWRRRRRLRTFAVVGKRQKRVTSLFPMVWLTETRAAWPVVTQMSYNDMKSRIEGLLSLEPACVAAHVGAMVRAMLAGRVNEVGGGAPASREPPTL